VTFGFCRYLYLGLGRSVFGFLGFWLLDSIGPIPWTQTHCTRWMVGAVSRARTGELSAALPSGLECEDSGISQLILSKMQNAESETSLAGPPVG